MNTNTIQVGDRIKYYFKLPSMAEEIHTGTVRKIERGAYYDVIFVVDDSTNSLYNTINTYVIEVIKELKYKIGDKVIFNVYGLLDTGYIENFCPSDNTYWIKKDNSITVYSIKAKNIVGLAPATPKPPAPKFAKGDKVIYDNREYVVTGIGFVFYDKMVTYHIKNDFRSHLYVSEHSLTIAPKETPIETFHALYSAEAAQTYGYCIYEGLDGKPVCVTGVGEDIVSMIRGYNWEDTKYVGLVKKNCIKSNTKNWIR